MDLKSYFLVETHAKPILSLLMDTRCFCAKDAKRGISMSMRKILKPKLSLVESPNQLSQKSSLQVTQKQIYLLKSYNLFPLTSIARYSKHMNAQDIAVLVLCAKWQKRDYSLVSNHTKYVTYFVLRVLQVKLCWLNFRIRVALRQQRIWNVYLQILPDHIVLLVAVISSTTCCLWMKRLDIHGHILFAMLIKPLSI